MKLHIWTDVAPDSDACSHAHPHSTPRPKTCRFSRTICALLTCLLALCAASTAAAQERDTTRRAHDAGEDEAGNADTASGLELKALPLATYSPDTSFAAGGVGLMHFDMPGESGRQSSINALGLYTLNKQLKSRLQWELAFDDRTWLFRGTAEGGSWPDDYHGIGLRAPADGERFDAEFFESTVGVRRLVPGVPRLYVGLLHDFEARAVSAKTGGRLAEQAPAGHRGGRLSGLGAEVVLDRRDSKYCPHEGAYAEARVTWFDDVMGSQYDMLEFRGDARRYWNLGAGHSIGVRGLFELQAGDVPFFAMNTLGGSKLNRGISGDRFRDKTLLSGQLEYRSPMFWRFSFSTFASLGAVAPSVPALMQQLPRWSAGGGVRFFVDKERGIPLRLDLGISEDNLTPGVYFSIGEAF